MCRSKYLLFCCQAFRNLRPSQRREAVTQYGVCFNCLRDGDVASSCPKTVSCVHCEMRHHSLFHLNSPSPDVPTAGGGAAPSSPRRDVNPDATVAPTALNCTLLSAESVPSRVLLATATLLVRSAGEDHMLVRMLLD